MAAVAILKIQFNGHNSVAVAHIHTKFGSETKSHVPETEIPSHFTSLAMTSHSLMPQPIDAMFGYAEL